MEEYRERGGDVVSSEHTEFTSVTSRPLDRSRKLRRKVWAKDVDF